MLSGSQCLMRFTAIALVLLAPFVGSAWADPPPLWEVDYPESAVSFTATQSGMPVVGGFEQFTADVTFDPEDPAGSSFVVEIDMASVESGNTDRDNALRSNGLFDVAVWPSAVFEANDVTTLGDGQYEARGTLTLRDQTLPIVLPFTLVLEGAPGARLATAEGSVTINRTDYGVGQGMFADTSVIPDPVEIAVRIVAREAGS